MWCSRVALCGYSLEDPYFWISGGSSGVGGGGGTDPSLSLLDGLLTKPLDPIFANLACNEEEDAQDDEGEEGTQDQRDLEQVDRKNSVMGFLRDSAACRIEYWHTPTPGASIWKYQLLYKH